MIFSKFLSFSTLVVLVVGQGFTNSTVYPLSTDSHFSFTLLGSLGFSDGYGSNPSEVLTAAASITAGDFESWYRSFDYLATHIYNISQQINSKKYPVSAREALFRSATYFRTSSFYLTGNISDPRLYSLWDQQAAAFDQAISLLPAPGYRVTLPADGFEVPVIFYPASNRHGKRPTILVGTGYDGSQEDLFHQLGFEVLSRGYNFATYEGPGQPTVRRNQGLGFIPQWGKVITPVMNYLSSHPKVDADAIALIGVSFGSAVTPLAAAVEHRMAAVMLLDGLPSVYDQILAGWPDELIQIYKSGNSTLFDKVTLAAAANTSTPTSLRWFINQGLWAFNTRSPYDLLQQISQYTLTKEILQNITCPTFVGQGLDDSSSTQASLVAEGIGKKATLFKFGSDIGAGEHCQVGAESYLAQVTMDWFQEVLDARNGTGYNKTKLVR